MKTGKRHLKVLLLLLAFLNFGIFFVQFSGAHAFLEPGPGEGYATIYVSPSSVSLTSPPYNVGDKFTVEVRVHNYSQVASWQVKLVWDARLINLTSKDDVGYVPSGDFIFPSGHHIDVSPSIDNFNSTHKYVMQTSATYGAVEYEGEDAGLMRFNFTIISVPPKGSVFSCSLWLEPTDTWTCDENVEENDEARVDGYYEITVVAAVYLSPSVIVINSPPAKENDTFDVTIRIANYSNVAKWQIKLWFNNTLLNCTGVSPASDFVFSLNESLRYSELKNDEGYVLMRASTVGFAEYSGADAGLAKISFAIVRVPGENQNLTCLLHLDEADTWIKTLMDTEIPMGCVDSEYIIVSVSSQKSVVPFEIIVSVVLVTVVIFVVGIFLLRRRGKILPKKD